MKMKVDIHLLVLKEHHFYEILVIIYIYMYGFMNIINLNHKYISLTYDSKYINYPLIQIQQKDPFMGLNILNMLLFIFCCRTVGILKFIFLTQCLSTYFAGNFQFICNVFVRRVPTYVRRVAVCVPTCFTIVITNINPSPGPTANHAKLVCTNSARSHLE